MAPASTPRSISASVSYVVRISTRVRGKRGHDLGRGGHSVEHGHPQVHQRHVGLVAARRARGPRGRRPPRRRSRCVVSEASRATTPARMTAWSSTTMMRIALPVIPNTPDAPAARRPVTPQPRFHRAPGKHGNQGQHARAVADRTGDGEPRRPARPAACASRPVRSRASPPTTKPRPSSVISSSTPYGCLVRTTPTVDARRVLAYVGEGLLGAAQQRDPGLLVALDVRQLGVDGEPGVLGEAVQGPAQRVPPPSRPRLPPARCAEPTRTRASARFSRAVFSIDAQLLGASRRVGLQPGPGRLREHDDRGEALRERVVDLPRQAARARPPRPGAGAPRTAGAWACSNSTISRGPLRALRHHGMRPTAR